MNLLILFLSEEEMNDCHLIVLGYMENNEIGQVGCLWYSMSRTNCNHKHESMLLSIGWGTFMSYILGFCNLRWEFKYSLVRTNCVLAAS